MTAVKFNDDATVLPHGPKMKRWLRRRLAGDSSHGDAIQWYVRVHNSLAHLRVVVSSSTAAGSGGASERGGGELRAKVARTTRQLSTRMSARMSNRRVH